MEAAVWIVTILAAIAFGVAGFSKLTQPQEKLKSQMKWVEDFSPMQIRAIGALELLGAIGLVLPSLTMILPVLTPLAAIGLVIVMLGAAFTHIRRQEYSMIGINVVLMLLVLFVAYGRLVAVPLA